MFVVFLGYSESPATEEVSPDSNAIGWLFMFAGVRSKDYSTSNLNNPSRMSFNPLKTDMLAGSV